MLSCPINEFISVSKKKCNKYASGMAAQPKSSHVTATADRESDDEKASALNARKIMENTPKGTRYEPKSTQ